MFQSKKIKALSYLNEMILYSRLQQKFIIDLKSHFCFFFKALHGDILEETKLPNFIISQILSHSVKKSINKDINDQTKMYKFTR